MPHKIQSSFKKAGVWNRILYCDQCETVIFQMTNFDSLSTMGQESITNTNHAIYYPDIKEHHLKVETEYLDAIQNEEILRNYQKCIQCFNLEMYKACCLYFLVLVDMICDDIITTQSSDSPTKGERMNSKIDSEIDEDKMNQVEVKEGMEKSLSEVELEGFSIEQEKYTKLGLTHPVESKIIQDEEEETIIDQNLSLTALSQKIEALIQQGDENIDFFYEVIHRIGEESLLKFEPSEHELKRWIGYIDGYIQVEYAVKYRKKRASQLMSEIKTKR